MNSKTTLKEKNANNYLTHTKNSKGITLVALVITIIILLILAGISISALTNQGIFGKAQQAKQEAENAQRNEEAILANYFEQMNVISEKTLGENESVTQVGVEPSTATTHTAKIITYNWDELSNIAKSISNNSTITNNTLEIKVKLNEEEKTLGVGDIATVDGKKVRILGFNHDTLTNSTAYGTTTVTGKAGISFEYVDFINIDGNGTTMARMNVTNTNKDGWGASALKSTLNSTTYNNLSIKNKIKQVNKEFIPNYNQTSKSISTDFLWLLSCGEIWDNGYNGGITRGYAIATEGNQYKYYKSNLGSASYKSKNNTTKKPSASNASTWWLRSPGYDR